MKLSSIAACLFLAAAAAAAFVPWSPNAPSSCAFEVHVESDHSGLVQLYFQLGTAMSEDDSVLQPIEAGRPRTLRFALPSGAIRAFRLDPLDRDARVTLRDARIVDGSGQTLAVFSPARFQALNQIELLEARGADLRVETTPGGTDPQLSIKLDRPIEIPRASRMWPLLELFAVLVGGLALVDWARRSPSARLDERATGLWDAACAHPARAVLAAALLGTLAANYPVVFAGRSLVSPNLGAAALYGQTPWLPGFQSAEAPRVDAADVGVLFWHHLPLSIVEHRALFHDGELPLWNRYDSAGSPLLGQGQSCFGDPLQLIPILADGAAWSWDLKYLLAKWLFAFGIGLCCWHSFRSLPSALAMAVSVSFIGMFVYRVNHPAIFSLCYAPWILYCWLRICGTASARGAVLGLLALIGANWAEMNSGTVKEAYVLLASMNLAGACALLASGRTIRAKAALLAGAVAAGAVFAMASAPVWLVFYRTLKASYTSYAAPQDFQLQPGMLLGLFDEAFFRPFQKGLGVINPSANLFVLIGLCWALVRWRSVLADRSAAGLAASASALLLVAFGVIPPALIARVPFLGNILHVDNTFSCALIVILSVLASLGWREAWERIGTREGKGEALAVLALLVAAFAALLGTAQAEVRSAYWADTWGRLITIPGFVTAYGWSLLAAAAVLLFALRLSRARGRASPAIVLCAATAFGALHWRMGLQLDSPFRDFVVSPPHRVDLKAESPAITTVQARMADPARVVGFNDDFLPGWSAVTNLEGISGPDALVNPYYRAFMDAAGVPRVWDWRYMVTAQDLPVVRKVLDAINVRFYLSYRGAVGDAEKLLKRVESSDMEVFESPSAWPRAFFTDSAAVYGDLPQFCSWVKAGDGRPFAAVERSDWAALNPAPKVSGDLAKRTVTPAEGYILTANTTSFTVRAGGPGFIVLTEAYERNNFHATLNGARVPYLRVNGAFKGIYVESAGTYQVSYEYYPRGLEGALFLCAAGFALIALAGVYVIRARPAQI